MGEQRAASRAGNRPAQPTPAAVNWAEVAAAAPEGLAVVDASGRFTRLNSAAVQLCGLAEEDLIGARAPFPLGQDSATGTPGLLEDDASAEHVTAWSREPGARREFAYRLHRLPASPELTVVAFRDVTGDRQRQRRVTAIARTAANLATQGSLTATLDALAGEVVQADALAGVQILTLDSSGLRLRIMGAAGFAHWPDFFERLMQVRERGAPLLMLKALATGETVIVPDRWKVIRDDPAWAPLRTYLGELEWESFASVPLTVRGQEAGVLNAFFKPGEAIGRHTLEFLAAMAEQAAVAIDYAALLERERDAARREERQRLARDLHDSIVQQVFSISMQAESMAVLAQRDSTLPAEAVLRISDEVGLLSKAALTDLRAMVHELRPSSTAELGGLEEAIRALAASAANRTGLRFRLSLGQGLERVTGEQAEDVYRILAEAIHNVVKHAAASRVTIQLTVSGDKLSARVTDYGCGITVDSSGGGPAGPDTGYGLKTMRERAERWRGTVTVKPRREGGTVVRLSLPLAVGVPLDPTGPPPGTRPTSPATDPQ